MSRIGIRITTVGAAAAGLFTAFLAMSPTAAADPAAPVVPGIPGIDGIVQQLADVPAKIPQMLQSAASAFGGAPQAPTMPGAQTMPRHRLDLACSKLNRLDRASRRTVAAGLAPFGDTHAGLQSPTER